MEWVGVNVVQHSQPKGFKVKMRGYKLRNDVYWQGVVQKCIKHVGHRGRDTYICH